MNKHETKGMEEKETLLYPLMDDLLKHVPNKYELVLLAALRAKQIVYKSRRLQMSETGLDEESNEQKSTLKPLTQALYEIAESKLEREKLYFFEYLEGFRKGGENIHLTTKGTAKTEFEFVPSEEIVVEQDASSEEEGEFFEEGELEEE